MTAFFIILGGVLGGFGFDGEGILLGAVIGYLVSRSIYSDRAVKELRSDIAALRKKATPITSPLDAQPSASQPAPAEIWPETSIPDTEPDKETEWVNAAESIPATAAEQNPQDSIIKIKLEPVHDDPWMSSTITSVTPAAEPPWLAAIKRYFTGGNTVARAGIIILFIGMAFLAKYAAEKGVFPIEVRMAGIALSGLVLIILGWRLKAKPQGYGVALLGGGIGVIYLTIFASLRLYHLMPAAFAFALLLVVCGLSAALSVLMNSRALAILGFSGGFLAPALTSTGGGSHVLLFSYYALLNTGVLAIAWYRAWRPLNIVGFVFTFIIGSLWGFKNYHSGLFASTEPFLILFFIFYTAIAVLYAMRRPGNLRGYVDGTLVFGTPIIVFSLQYAVVRHIEYGFAYSAMALCSFYVLLAYGLFKYVAKYNTNDQLRLLCESFLAIGITFGTVAVPLALDDAWTAAAWALEGGALVYVGIRQRRDLAYFSGILLQFAAAWFVLASLQNIPHHEHWPVINGAYLNGVLVAIAALFTSYLSFRYHHHVKRYFREIDVIMLGWGVCWWIGIGLYEIHHHTIRPGSFGWFLVLGIVTSLSAHVIGLKLSWPRMKVLDQALALFMVLTLLGSILTLQHPLVIELVPAWVIAFVVFYVLLKRNDREELDRLQLIMHGIGIWVVTALLTWESHWRVEQWLPKPSAWSYTIWIVAPSVMVTLIHRAKTWLHWPFGIHRTAYAGDVSAPLMLWSVLAIVGACLTEAGHATPLPYLPILNPLDVACIMGLILLAGWWHELKLLEHAISEHIGTANFLGWLAGLAFLLINSALIKTIHHWYHVPLTLGDMIASDLAQTSLTVLWTILAMGTMFVANRRQWRPVWLVGGALLGVVVAKLFLVDLDNSGTVERIVSFISVGALMLVIGYFTPFPPKAEMKNEKVDA
ncbi:MAG: DUF2339 domain-containing protein [Gammaproteobacteria bacterium]|nr:DUF2339 domain-containing protein [Gammaproteobacteria bacterium]